MNHPAITTPTVSIQRPTMSRWRMRDGFSADIREKQVNTRIVRIGLVSLAMLGAHTYDLHLQRMPCAVHRPEWKSPGLMKIKAGPQELPDRYKMEWRAIASAPFGRDLELAVIEASGIHALIFPCRRVLRGWVEAETTAPVDVHPTHWREWDASVSTSSARSVP